MTRGNDDAGDLNLDLNVPWPETSLCKESQRDVSQLCFGNRLENVSAWQAWLGFPRSEHLNLLV